MLQQERDRQCKLDGQGAAGISDVVGVRDVAEGIDVDREQEQALIKWLNNDIVHFSKLQIDDPIIEKVLKKFNTEDSMFLYCQIRECFWRINISSQNFLTIVENNIDQSYNIDDLVNNINLEFKVKKLIKKSASV